MTDPIRPAVDVWCDAHNAAFDGWTSCHDGPNRQASAAIIEADREAVKAYWYRQGKADGSQHERAKIVAWLRDQWERGELVCGDELADAIDRGDHTGGGDGAD